MNKRHQSAQSKAGVEHVKNIVIFIGFVVLLFFGAVLFLNNFLPLKERLLLISMLFVLDLLLAIGIKGLRGTGAGLVLLLFLLVTGVQGFAGYVVWSSMATLDQVSSEDDPSAEQWNASEATTPFHLFLSGKDTDGSIDPNSRSDVNMILTVNPATHTMNVTTIPRDAYMRIQGEGENEYDKLTHAGLNGVKSSVQTLEKFFGIKIPYYVVVNFDSVIDIVNLLGGVDVDNPEDFVSLDDHFVKGRIHLNGDQALNFARARYGLKDGEMGRGRNHVRLLEAMIRKAISPAIITQYSSILNVVGNKMVTNMSREKIVDLVNYQISNNEPWKMESAQLQGFQTIGLPSYRIPDVDLYMMLPSQESKRDILAQMNAVMEGKTVTSLSKSSYELHHEDWADLPIDNIYDYLQENYTATPENEASYDVEVDQQGSIETPSYSSEEDHHAPTQNTSDASTEPHEPSADEPGQDQTENTAPVEVEEENGSE